MDVFLKLKAWQMFMLLVGRPFVLILLLFPLGLMNVWLFFAWLWAMGTALNAYAPSDLRPSLRLFRMSINYIVLYFVIALTAVTAINNGQLGKAFILLLIPLHLMGMFYGLFFIAKNLIITETRQKSTLKNLLPLFVLIWVYPFGIWFIQPRINKLHFLHR